MTYDLDSIGGNCPVQADITLRHNGEERLAYFRARGDAWSVEVWAPGRKRASSDGLPEGSAEWFIEMDWGTGYDAGWMELDAARALIAWALDGWAADWPSDAANRPGFALPEPPSRGGLVAMLTEDEARAGIERLKAIVAKRGQRP